VSAVLVGINTVIEDNPYLTDRLVGRRNPIRVVLDPHLKIPLQSNFLKPDSRRIIITERHSDSKKLEQLRSQDVEFLFFEGRYYILSVLLRELGSLNIASLLVEGGGQIFSQFLNQKLYDELYLFLSPQTIEGGKKIDIDESLIKEGISEKIGEDLLYHVYRHS
jgi:diaminohydroxyphosphoribosylaminopyrimidine deaminase/5-amino-6-(5-phosphoribosylamino)uracil reductase